MSDPVIRVENLSKKYIISHQKPERYMALRDVIANGAKSLTQRIFQPHKKVIDSDREEFWALKDVSFEVNQGDRIGIIGRNGAGKSTLLKILSRITEPTSGRITINGRVASLLEVGTGFHPELTGRENIYLNGSILGMSKAEIKKKFDEIIDFAEVEKFLDTPVKHYSSGMYVRLAFAVAAHLEPEILIVDEVLAVGDAQFQKKCMGKMEDVSKEGRTVIFVSHNMASISALCSRAIILKDGLVQFFTNNIDDAISKYLLLIDDATNVQLEYRKDRNGEGKIRLTEFAVYDRLGNELEYLACGQTVEMRIYFKCDRQNVAKNISFGIGIYSTLGNFITELSNEIATNIFDTISDRGFTSCLIDKLPIAPGKYLINLIVRQNDIIQDWITDAAVLTIESGDFYGTGRLSADTHRGMLIEQKWSVVN
jgi:lipopolysaccharide transport system ATP-binding protein